MLLVGALTSSSATPSARIRNTLKMDTRPNPAVHIEDVMTTFGLRLPR